MYLVAAIISFEIILGIFIASPPQKQALNTHLPSGGSQVLGDSEVSDQPSDQPSNQNSDQQSSDTSSQTKDQSSSSQQSSPETPAQTEPQAQTQTSEQSPSNPSSSTQTQSTPETPPLGQPLEQPMFTPPPNSLPQITSAPQETESVPTSEITPEQSSQNPSPQIEPSPQISQNPSELETTQNAKNAFQADVKSTVEVLDTQVFTNVTDKSPSAELSDKTVQEVAQQEHQLQSAKTPEEQANLLTHFETNTMQTLNTDLKNNNFDDVSFNAQRLSHQIDQSLSVIEQLPSAKAGTFRNKIEEVCKNAEYVLRSEELVVPEDTEESLAISRGKCFNFEK